MASDKLTPKQEGFSQDVASGKFDFDWLSYKANYSTKGWSMNAIYVETCKLLQHPKIILRIAELRKEAIARNQVTVDQVLEQLANWLLFDPLSIIDEETECVKSMKSIEKKDRMSLAEIQVTELWGFEPSVTDPKKKVKVKTGELKKIKFVDKRATAEMFMKKFGQYVSEQNDIASNLDAIKDIIESVKK